MTGLYRLDAPADQIAAAMEAQIGRDIWEGGYLTPGKFAPVIARAGHSGNRVMRPMHWGYPPPNWQPETALLDGAAPRWVATVRNLTSPFWIGNLRHTELRCLVPVTAFQIWSERADPTTGKKAQHWFTVPSQPVFAFAGIWRDLTDMPVFAFLTSDANDLVDAVNPKSMPVILHPEDYDVWLNADWKEAQRVVEPFPAKLMHDAQSSPH